MEKQFNVRRIAPGSESSHKNRARSKASTSLVAEKGLVRRKLKAQALVLVALCMVLLIAIVGLAIDGGSLMGLRRQAQNGADGAALAGTRHMLDYYVEMIRANPDEDVDYNHTVELAIRNAIDDYAARNGVVTSTLEAYFVNDDKQLITVNRGVERGPGACGVGQARGYCQVGENGRVPWSLGAKGIDVRASAQSRSFFMSIMGWDTVSAGASATAFMGVGAMEDNVSVVPIGLYTTTLDVYNLVEGAHYQLIDAALDNGSGNWGWVDFNGQGISATTARAWLTCGFNPSVTQTQWENSWCPQHRNAPGWGPTRHYMPQVEDEDWPAWQPQDVETFIPSIVYGEHYYGWWVRGSSGQVNSNCKDFEDRVDAGGAEGVEVIFPIFDKVVPGGGTDSLYHVRILVAFRLINNGPRRDVSCRPQDAPTPIPLPTSTPCAVPPCDPTPTPLPNPPRRTHWHIEGDAVKIYSTSSHGRHGDIRRTFAPLVFLDR